jgi:DNA mismatch repair protein MutS2
LTPTFSFVFITLQKDLPVIFPVNFEQKIGFDTIRQMLKEACLSEPGRYLVDEIKPAYRLKTIAHTLGQTEELRQILLFELHFPSQDYIDMSAELNRITTEGSYIEPDAMLDLKLSLNTILSLLSFAQTERERSYPLLKELASDIFIDSGIIIRINQTVNEKGLIRDDASTELSRIRKAIISKQGTIQNRISKSLASAKREGWAQSNAEIVIRNGRLVIPLPAVNKRKIKGFIHDESATGQTVYIEPAEIFEINNDIRELEYAEKREIIRILVAFADFLRPFIQDLLIAYQFLGKVDFLRAKAKIALEFGGVMPLLSSNPSINWMDARHPLLFLSHQAQKKIIEPLNIVLNAEERILIISGPNAGGKSVCLKTVGLLQYMAQCGLLVPLRETSEVGIFKDIFIDIGDEQSLENDLSTYSSHLLNMKVMLDKASDQSLILIDEFGAGTEPQVGGAIAETILSKFNSRNAFGVVTTHYANLKLLAGKEKGIINGAMLFDTRQMQPLFKLVIGKPGSSFAFEIAHNIGLPDEIIMLASEKIGTSQLDFDKQLEELETEKFELIKKEKQLRAADEMLSELISKYERLNAQLSDKKKQIITEAREEAGRIVGESNTLIEKTIREIKQTQAAKAATKQLREEMKQHAEKLSEPVNPAPVKLIAEIANNQIVNTNPLVAGDFVTIGATTAIGKLFRIDNEKAEVQFGTAMVKVDLNKLVRASKSISKNESEGYRNYSQNNIINDLNARMANFRLTLDVRGKRADEALTLVQHYIDEAVLLNMDEVHILHGKGNGILRNLIRQLLHEAPEIQKAYDEEPERGGSGITIVRLRDRKPS